MNSYVARKIIDVRKILDLAFYYVQLSFKHAVEATSNLNSSNFYIIYIIFIIYYIFIYFYNFYITVAYLRLKYLCNWKKSDINCRFNALNPYTLNLIHKGINTILSTKSKRDA